MNESELDNNFSSSSSNASVDQYLASVRNKNNKNNDLSGKNKLHNSLVIDNTSYISSNNDVNNKSLKNLKNSSYDDFEISVDHISDRNQNLGINIKIEIEEEEEENEASLKRKIIKQIHAIRPKKKKRSNVNKKINGSNQSNEQTKTKKSSLFDPERYQNKKEKLTKQQEKWIVPPKKKPKKEIDEMVNRLSKPSPRFDVQIPENLTQKKPAANPQIFDRLYEMSTEKEKKNEERRIQQEKERDEYFLNSSPKSNAKSQLLAEKMQLRFVEKCFNSFPKDPTLNVSQQSINNMISNSSQNEVKDENSITNEGKVINKNENKKENDENNGNTENQNNDNDNIISCLNDSNDYYFKSELTQEELDQLLILLGLRSKSENIPKFNKILFEKMNDWVLKEKQDGSRVYDAIKIHGEMIHVIKEGEFSFSPFDRFARQRIIIELSNSKQSNSLSKPSVYNSNTETLIKPSNESLNDNDESEINSSSKTIHYKSLLRLSQSKKNYPESPKENEIYTLKIRPRPKFMMNPYSEELEPATLSTKTEKIFKKSEVANIPFVERDQFFTEKRRKMMEKMSEESNRSQLMKFEHKPKFSQETRQELNEYREKKEKRKRCRNDEPTYHPKIMNYDMYKKTIHKEMTEKKVRPEGWDSNITRHRIAYQKYLQEKLAKEKNNEQEYDMMNELDIVSKYKL